MALPNAFIIGAPKAGTTALYKILAQHPSIYMSAMKEPHYFSYKYDCWPEWATTSLKDYEELFREVQDESVVGEASTWYLYSTTAATAIKEILPDAKLIALLRNPVERAYSSFMFRQQCGWEALKTFEEALRQEPERIAQKMPWDYHYLNVGFYGKQLKRYYDQFDAQQIQIYLHDDLKADAMAVAKSAFKFLGVDESRSIDFSRQHNVTLQPKHKGINNFLARQSPLKSLLKRGIPASFRKTMVNAIRQKNLTKPSTLNPETKSRLVKIFHDDILQLQDLIDRDLTQWLKT